jgi:hypothetical protein
MRNKIRYAIEVCSVSKMKSSMEARNKLVHIYGPDLCSEEVAAVMNMMRMLSLAPSAAKEKAEDEDLPEDDEEDEASADGEATQEVCLPACLPACLLLHLMHFQLTPAISTLSNPTPCSPLSFASNWTFFVVLRTPQVDLNHIIISSFVCRN